MVHKAVQGKKAVQINTKAMIEPTKNADAVSVYLTEKGFDAESWDIIYPEMKIFNRALRDGRGWYDLIYDRGKFLMPQPQPYKIVEITYDELQKIRTREKEERIAAQKSAEVKRIATELYNQSIHDTNIRQAKLVFYDQTVTSILDKIRGFPDEMLVMTYLVDFIAEQIQQLPVSDYDEIIERICPRIYAEGLLCATPLPNLTTEHEEFEEPTIEMENFITIPQDQEEIPFENEQIFYNGNIYNQTYDNYGNYVYVLQDNIIESNTQTLPTYGYDLCLDPYCIECNPIPSVNVLVNHCNNPSCKICIHLVPTSPYNPNMVSVIMSCRSSEVEKSTINIRKLEMPSASNILKFINPIS
jgi:hypothetical protein